ncbi:hypothetical protein OVS_02775 [Mycoplasma ovis str. Michigan]|uniref:Uncharacterized protein n=1 Tax=Mycoplasma ovis str. Michigan TaxID=1415773 RepID=A0ABN4BR44_9MOLU|nr:hypothetical protein OVS_02775 [Mycoplasma ovis str. Michigan]
MHRNITYSLKIFQWILNQYSKTAWTPKTLNQPLIKYLKEFCWKKQETI